MRMHYPGERGFHLLCGRGRGAGRGWAGLGGAGRVGEKDFLFLPTLITPECGEREREKALEPKGLSGMEPRLPEAFNKDKRGLPPPLLSGEGGGGRRGKNECSREDKDRHIFFFFFHLAALLLVRVRHLNLSS